MSNAEAATLAPRLPRVEPAALDGPGLEWRWPLRMQNPVRRYDWGSRSALARLQGRPTALGPEAELWMGAHPGAPSSLLDLDGRPIRLDDAVTGDPLGLLGPECLGRYGPRLPFLLKVIAAERGLSVQVHPVADAAAAGFAAAAAAGPGDGAAMPAPFVDPYGKSELLVALEPFEALAGLRAPRRSGELLDLLDVAPLLPMRRGLTAASMALDPHRARAATLEALVRLASWPQRQRAVLAAAVTDAARAVLVDPRRLHDPDTRLALEWVMRLAYQHPADPMVLAPLLLDVVRLEPGGSLFVPAGVLHSCLSGVAVEVSTSSDNVARAGLTSKPVDVALLHRLSRPEVAAEVGVGTLAAGPHETVLLAPAEEFRLSRVAVRDGSLVTLAAHVPGPQVLFCLSGEVSVWAGAHQLALSGGESVYVGPGADDCVLSGGGDVLRVTPGTW